MLTKLAVHDRVPPLPLRLAKRYDRTIKKLEKKAKSVFKKTDTNGDKVIDKKESVTPPWPATRCLARQVVRSGLLTHQPQRPPPVLSRAHVCHGPTQAAAAHGRARRSHRP